MSKKIISKVLNQTYSFPKSKADMELLRNLNKNEVPATDTKNKEDFQYYMMVFNICNEFNEQLLDTIPLLDPFNNRVCDMQEEYMPSGPPMSPVTTSFFNAWMALDAPISEALTLGLLYSRYIREKKVMLYAEKAMDNLNASYVSLYQVVGGDLKQTILWDILEKRELSAAIPIHDYSVATYKPSVGDVWYARILPSLRSEDFPHVVFGTPLIFRLTKREDWESFFSRRIASKGSDREELRNYLKRGDSFGYWLEFVFQTYVGHTREVIFAEGIPDIKQSRPHGRLDGGRMS